MIGGQNVLISRKRVLLDFIWGRWGVTFQTPLFHQTCQTSSPENLVKGEKLGAKIIWNFCLGGVFPGKGKSRAGYVLKTAGHACVQQYLSAKTDQKIK